MSKNNFILNNIILKFIILTTLIFFKKHYKFIFLNIKHFNLVHKQYTYALNFTKIIFLYKYFNLIVLVTKTIKLKYFISIKPINTINMRALYSTISDFSSITSTFFLTKFSFLKNQLILKTPSIYLLKYKNIDRFINCISYKYFYDWYNLNTLLDKFFYYLYNINFLIKKPIFMQYKIKKKISSNWVFYSLNQLLYNNIYINYNLGVLQWSNKKMGRIFIFQQNFKSDIYFNEMYIIYNKLFAPVYFLNLNFILTNVLRRTKSIKFIFTNMIKSKTLLKNPSYFKVKKHFFQHFLFLSSNLKKLLYNYIYKKYFSKSKQQLNLIQGNFLLKYKKYYLFTKINSQNINNTQHAQFCSNNIEQFYKIFWFLYCVTSYKLHYYSLSYLSIISEIFKTISPKSSNLLFNYTHNFTNVSKFLKYIILKKTMKFFKKTSHFIKYFYFFFLNFFEHFFKTNVYIKIYLNNDLSNKSLETINWLTKKYFSFQISMGKGFFLNEMLYVLFYMFKYKDIFIFKHWLKINLERMFFVKHKKFFYKLKLILKDIFSLMVRIFKIKGFYLGVAGKISSAGNSRKKRYLITFGFSSFSGYQYKITYTKYIIRTKTGALGVTTALTYL